MEVGFVIVLGEEVQFVQRVGQLVHTVIKICGHSGSDRRIWQRTGHHLGLIDFGSTFFDVGHERIH